MFGLLDKRLDNPSHAEKGYIFTLFSANYLLLNLYQKEC